MTANPAPGQGTLVMLQGDVEAALPKAYGTCASIDDPTKHGSPTTVERLMYRATSCCPFTVSSVASVELIVERAGSSMEEGIRSRVLTVDTSKMPRISLRRADAIKHTAETNYGHAAPRFLAQLVNEGLHQDTGRLRKMVEDHAASLEGAEDDGEAWSIAKHIGILYVVGEVMMRAGLIPSEADGDTLLQGVWNDWRLRRTTTPVVRAIRDLDTALADAGTFGDDPAAACWVQDGIGYVATDRIEEIIGDEVKAALVMRQLKDKGRLIPASGRNLAWHRLPAWATNAPSASTTG